MVKHFTTKELDGVICKQCTTCDKWLSLSDSFYRYKDGSPQSNCKDCVKRRGREAYRSLKREAVTKLGNKCADCQQSFPACVYDFHHLDPSQKDLSVSRIRRKCDIDKFWQEVSKCVLLCSNCHRLRHFAVENDTEDGIFSE